MTQETDYDLLFQDYINVCNRALEKCAQTFPFNKILDSVQKNDKEKVVEVRIIDDYSIPLYRLKINKNRVAVATCASKNGCCNRCVKGQWLIQASYLKEVVTKPDRYINNPALINWEWLQAETEVAA